MIFEALRPFLIHFRDLEFNRSATPLDYAFLIEDVQFLNLLDYRLQFFRVADVPTHERVVASIEALMAEIEEELGR